MNRDALEDDDDLEKVLKKAFVDVDEALHTHLSYFNNGDTYCNNVITRYNNITPPHPPFPASFLTAGTTATVAMLRGGVELVVGSAGDSRALLCRKGGANALTRDHTPDRTDERRRYTSGSVRRLCTRGDAERPFAFRIQRFGGFVAWNGSGEASVNGRLAVTRSIGDFRLKASGVIAEPDTRRLNVSPAKNQKKHLAPCFRATSDGGDE